MKYIKLFETLALYKKYAATLDETNTPNVSLCKDTMNLGYTELIPHDYSKDYLTFEALEAGTFTFTKALSYSLDGGSTWTSLAANTATTSVAIGNEICFKAELTPNSSNGIGTFSATGNFNAKGNPMSLLFGDNFVGQTSLSGKDYAFYRLFKNNTKLISIEYLSLSATTLAQYCYMKMYDGCTSLTTVTKLPAKTLTYGCYTYMFYGCTSLTTAPELPATTLAENCYNSMFSGCTLLTTVPKLPVTTLVNQCYYFMFSNCTSLTTAPELPATTLASKCYQSMFAGCTSLITTPDLPATTLVDSCYQNMFYGCTSLNYIKCLATDISASNCTNNWVSGVSATGTFFKAASMTDWTSGTNGIPSGWTIQDAA